MSPESRINSDGQEQVSYSNAKIQLVVGRHLAGTERAYTTYRGKIDDIGVHFFKRGSNFNNVLFVEDSSGTLESRIEELNNSAKKFRSYRTAYWYMRGIKDSDATKMTQLFDRNPVERFVRMARNDGKDNLSGQLEAYTYGTFDALDNIRRKGYDVRLAAERKRKARGQLIEFEMRGGDVFSWREVARLNLETDKDLAVQIENVISQNPERTRLLAVFGTAHAPIRESFPTVLQQICEVVELNPKSDGAVLLRDIQQGNLSDEEIRQRISRIKKSDQFGK